MRVVVSRSFFLALFILLQGLAVAAPQHVYLTWQGDTSTTMTVNYQTSAESSVSQVRYDTVARSDLASYRFSATGTAHKVPGVADGRAVHNVELSGLEPGTAYYFVAGDPQNGFSNEHKFRTIPQDDQALRFVSGGDMNVGKHTRRLLVQAGALDPLFALVGGDLAYVNGKTKNYAKWDQWLRAWQENMVTPDGFSVPMVLAIGNHEVEGGYGQSASQAPFYYGYFAQAGARAYFARRFGANLVLYVLDSGHTAPHDGAQLEWLASTMHQTRDVPYRFALYHVPLYPGFRSPQDPYAVAGRQHWRPLFDQYRLTTAFENHDHVLKRSKLLRNDQVDEAGTLYLGDGCFGKPTRFLRGPRREDRTKRWYIAHSASVPHFWLVDLSAEKVVFKGVDEHGAVVDEYELPRPVTP